MRIGFEDLSGWVGVSLSLLEQELARLVRLLGDSSIFPTLIPTFRHLNRDNHL